ncbi:MAG: NAD(+) diphosphatase [Chloroflexota bacterium]|nr:NAD(+) diphosphatase [Chloroflexota bacterium]
MREDERLRRAVDGASDDGEQSAGKVFAGFALGRVARQRRDETWVRERSRDPTTRFVPIWESKVLVSDQPTPRPILLRTEDAETLLQRAESVVLLGEAEGGAYFAIDLTEHDDLPPRLARAGEFRPLRSVAAILDWREAALLTYAKAMIYWHQRHRFCGDCGSATASTHGGHLRVCSNEQCRQHHFPRTDPAIIVRVSRGERCLLGRQPMWAEGLYSIIAGFVEPGENLEAAVAREVREETGIRLTGIRYHSSQPWPFPSSLMVGFTARATSASIRLHDGELEDARWLSRGEIADGLRQGSLRLPREISISYRLIEEWFDAGGSGQLKGMVESG